MSIRTDRLDGVDAGLALKAPCVVATTGNITLSGVQTIATVAVTAGQRVLVKNQTDAEDNGIYIVRAGDWDRADDWDGTRDAVPGTIVVVYVAATSALNLWQAVSVDNPIVIGTSLVTFAAIALTGATGATGAAGATGPTGAAGSLPIAVAAGTADAITADFSPDVTIADKAVILVVHGSANATTTPTLSTDGNTARTITKWGGQALAAGDIPAALFVGMYEYNLANTRWEMLNPANKHGTTVAKSANYTATLSDNRNTLICDATSAAFTISLPTAASAGAGFKLTIYKTDSSINAITVDGNGTETINGALTYTLPFQGNFIEIICNATGWFVISNNNAILGQYKVVSGADTYTPYGHVLAYGQAISRATYAAYFALVGTIYGVGDGATTFNVPDVRGRFFAGKDDMGGSAASRLTLPVSGGIDGTGLGNVGGEQSHTLITAEMPAHTHTNTLYNGGAGSTFPAISNSGSTGARDTGLATGSTGGGGAHNNIPPAIVGNIFIHVLI